MKKLIVAIAALTSATPALAQTVYHASGPRIDAHVGLDRSIFHASYSDGTGTYKDSDGKSGVTYGGEAGYDFDFSGVVVGVYAGIDGASTKDCSSVYGGDRLCIKAGRNISAGVRTGYVVGPNSIVYIKGGYSNGRVKVSYTDGIDSASDHDDRDGFHVGVGGEIGLRGHTYAKLEYDYTNYSDYTYDDGPEAVGLGLDRHQVLVGLGVRF